MLISSVSRFVCGKGKSGSTEMLSTSKSRRLSVLTVFLVPTGVPNDCPCGDEFHVICLTLRRVRANRVKKG